MEAIDTWSSSALPSSKPFRYEDFDDQSIALQSTSSDAASSTTITAETTVTSTGDSSETPQTTPEIDEDICAQGLKETRLSLVADEDEEKEHTSKTRRRRSQRLATTIAPHQPPTSHPPVTPKTRPLSSKTSVSTAPAKTSEPEDDLRRSLRTADKRKREETIQVSSTTRRASTRVSAIAANGRIINTPDGRRTKRSHEIMAEGSKSAGAKLGGSYEKKVKLDEAFKGKVQSGKDVGSSTRASESSDTSEEDKGPKPKIKKRWLNQGLYVGQESEMDLSLRPSSAKKKTKGGKKSRPNTFPQPMFLGMTIMNTRRDFKLPYSVFAPSEFKCGPIADWRRLNHNVFIGDASAYWKKEQPSQGKCVCEDECGDHCLNRCTWMECDDENCGVGRHCKNRSFTDLKERVKTGTRFAEGIEVILTVDRGHGLRATRSFEPGQIIVEYTGEIITQEESERRMDEVYKDKKNYYLMLFDQNMILDATRGSVARFVNHSCAPNCRMEKWLVAGKPRMALFAGDSGVEAGDELTYDYNFNWFKGVTQQSCKCGSEKCRGTLGKRTDAQKAAAPATPKKGPGRGRWGHKGNGKGKAKGKSAAAALTRKLTTARLRKVITKKVQKTAIILPKPKRKPPTRRRPASPEPPPRDPTPVSSAPSPVPSVADSEEEEEQPRPRPVNEIPQLIKNRGRPRITRTYKVNKTIAQSSTIAKAVTSAEAVENAKSIALEHANIITTSTTTTTATTATRNTRRLTTVTTNIAVSA